MTPLAAAMLLLAAAPGPSVEAFVRQTYAAWSVGDEMPIARSAMSDGMRRAVAECRALQKAVDAREGENSSFGMCSEDYDILCQCQDPSVTDWSKIVIAVTQADADHAEAVVTFPAAEGEAPDNDPDLRFVLTRNGGNWRVDDLWEYRMAGEGGDGSYRKRLAAASAEMRKQLSR